MEKRFSLSHNGTSIPCVISEPDFGEIQRLVLGVHGLGGSSSDIIQAGIAEEMELFGSVTMRFDFPAHGDNPDPELTLSGCVDTLTAVAAHLRSQYPQVKDLCVFATGFGAYVTLIALHHLLELPGQVKLVIQTPSVMMHQTLLEMRQISLATLRAMGTITFRSSRPFHVSYGFYKELSENLAMVTHPIPMLILQGEQDAYIRREDIQNFHRINEQSKLVIIPGASHRFLEPGAWDMVLDLTRDWFQFEQVLLSDWS